MNSFVLWLIKKSAEIVLSKLIEKILKDANIKNCLKLQILVLCLDWVLLKTPLKPEKLAQHLYQQQRQGK